jgi:hypothetical protein
MRGELALTTNEFIITTDLNDYTKVIEIPRDESVTQGR